MNNQAKIAELKKNINNKFFPEALKPKLLAQIEKLEAEDKASEKKGILPHPKPKQSKTSIAKNDGTPKFVIGDVVTSTKGTNKAKVIDRNMNNKNQYVYKVKNVGNGLEHEELENDLLLFEMEEIVFKPKKPKVARTVKSELKKYYAHREIKTVTVIENGKKVVYKGDDVLNGAQFLAKGGQVVKNIATYYPVRAIVEVTFTDDTTAKPINGYHIKKTAKPIAELGAALATEEIINNSIVDYHNPRFAYKKGGWINDSIKFTESDYKKLVNDSSDGYPFYSVKNGNKQLIHDEANDEIVAKWNKATNELELKSSEFSKKLKNWLIKNSYLQKNHYEKGGETEEGVDLFEDYENIPADVQEVLDTYSQAFEDGDYDGLTKAQEEVKKLGYTFDYYLDGQAYDLRKIGQKGKVEASEEFAEGGEVSTSGSGDFDYIKFLDYVQPKVAATLLENNVTLLNDYTIVQEGKEFEPVIIYKGIDGKANALSVGYFADNDPQLKLLLSIDFELDEMEYHIRSKGWNINDVDMYAKGGWVKDHKYLNKAEAYEMRYAKGKNRKGYMAKGGKVPTFDYKNEKYQKDKIISLKDVEKFFYYLVYVENLSFHPDDEFEGNMYDSLTKKQAITLDRYMLDCFDVCKENKVDIYGIAANPMLFKVNAVVGRKAKGVSIKQIADMHNVTEKYLRKQLARGQKVELEHTTDEAVAYAIAKDHIYENPDYYILLEKIEMKAKGGEVEEKWVVVKPNGYYSIRASNGAGRFLPSLEMAYTYSEIEAKKLAENLQKETPDIVIKAVKYGTPLEDDPYDKYAKGGEVEKDVNKLAIEYLIGKDIVRYHDEANNFVYQLPKSDVWIKIPREEVLECVKNHKDSLLNNKKGILPHPKPKRKGSQIFAKAAEIREPGEKWQDAVKRANLLLKK